MCLKVQVRGTGEILTTLHAAIKELDASMRESGRQAGVPQATIEEVVPFQIRNVLDGIAESIQIDGIAGMIPVATGDSLDKLGFADDLGRWTSLHKEYLEATAG